MKCLHVFEEWADDSCTGSTLVAEVLEGEPWNWKREPLAKSGVRQLAGENWEPDSIASWIGKFVQSVDVPDNVEKRWIETSVAGPVADGPLVVRHEFKRAGCSADCGALQLIQVVYGTRNGDIPLAPIGKWVGCVDAGRASPWCLHDGRAPAHPTRPYFYPPPIFRAEVSPATITLVDDVGGAIGREEIYLEGAAVCTGHLGADVEKVLGVLKYGWRDWGGVRAPDPDAAPSGPILVHSPSELFIALVDRDYPEYVESLK